MGISKTFNVADIYPYYSSDEPMYLDIPTNSRLSFSQVGDTNAEEVALEYLERRDRSEGRGENESKWIQSTGSLRTGRPNSTN